MKIYISGKITGDGGYRNKFAAAAELLDMTGYTAVNPVQFSHDDWPWEDNMRVALVLMLDCDGVALLPDWESSRGARIEARLATELRIPLASLSHWLASDFAGG